MTGNRPNEFDVAEFLPTYLSDLHAALKSKLSAGDWKDLFQCIPTPDEVSRSLLVSAAEAKKARAFFWTMLDLSTAHIRQADWDILSGYRGPGTDGDYDRDDGQSLFVTPSACGWIISTSGCLAPEGVLEPKALLALEENRAEVIDRMRAEGLSDEFIAIFRYGYENGASDIRFHRDADALPQFPTFDLDAPSEGVSMSFHR